MKKISFLFGSGISLSSKLPDVRTITIKLLSEDYFYSTYTDKITYPSQEKVQHYKKFLKKLSNYCIALNLNNTYEDLFYFTKSIEKSLCHKECGDFFVNFFIDNIMHDLPNLVDDENIKINKNIIYSSFKQFIFELNLYIQKFVANNLRRADKLEDIGRFINMLLENDNYKCDIFTLNHDILLESSLKEKGKDYNVGFGKNNKFQIENFIKSTFQFNIFKLHGSINWNRGKDVNRKDYIFETDSSTPFNKHSDTSPYFIMGTFNKYELYSYGIFYDLAHEFRSRLSQTNKLFVSGYGFRDEGINSVLLEWMEKGSENEIHIFHKSKNSLIGSSNVFVGWEWKKRLTSGQIKIIEKYFEKIEWEDIALAPPN